MHELHTQATPLSQNYVYASLDQHPLEHQYLREKQALANATMRVHELKQRLSHDQAYRPLNKAGGLAPH